MNYKELLFNKDKSLTFYPELAVILNEYDKHLVKIGYEANGKKWKSKQCGLNAAVVINQINYWNELNEKLENKKHFKDGYYWTYHAYDKWAKEDFPFWSGDTVRRTVKFLEDIGLVISTDKYNTWKVDNTKWYRIDYDKLQKIINIVEELRKSKQSEEKDDENKNDREKQSAYTVNADCDTVMASCIDGMCNLPKPIPENTNKDYNPNSKAHSFFAKKVRERNKIFNPDEIDQSELKERISYVLEDLKTDVFGDEQADNIMSCMTYFIEQYAAVFGKRHPLLSESTINDVIANITGSMDVIHENMEFNTSFEPLVPPYYDKEAYKEIIDMYFTTEFKQDIDYSMVHFSQKNVLTKLMGKAYKKTWYKNWTK